MPLTTVTQVVVQWVIVRYCDILLKKSSKNPEEAELEDTLNQVIE